MTRQVLLGFVMLWVLTALAAPRFFVEATIDETRPWVQAQTVVRIRFFQGGDLNGLEWLPPQARLADIVVLGEETVNEVLREGQRYRVHERRYAVTPFASGDIEINGAGVRGRLPGSLLPANWQSGPLPLQVRPAPAGMVRWLPARNLHVTESWSGESAVGRIMTRTIMIEAEGIRATSLPIPDFSVAGASVIAHPPKRTEEQRGDFIIARLSQSFDILPQRAGELDVQPVHVAWWKVGAGEAAASSLPGRRLKIPPVAQPEEPPPADWTLPGIALLLGALTWFGWRFLYWQWLCRFGTLQRLGAVLLERGCRRWPNDPPLSLLDLGSRLSDQRAAQLLQALDAHLYGGRELTTEVRRLGASVGGAC